MNKNDMSDNFEKNVQYLKNNIPPDDIYMFCEQTFMATLFFFKKWSEHVNVPEEMIKDPIVNKWVTNILSFQQCRHLGIDIHLDLNLDSVEE